jgi:hypothetical protein
MRFFIAAAGICLALVGSQPAWAWGCVGHQVVAYIASENLSDNAASQVAGLLQDADCPVKRFCSATNLDRQLYA